ncbi:hypothetical protein DID75_00075 [Candidatus Marinamargulisbacteria bacterium SCGC AG-410-N11]|nr:hypothetical protein DID75_00075 [Candidatus Marinamargulisbacteria bacterium SCGC AG-410-N11]
MKIFLFVLNSFLISTLLCLLVKKVCYKVGFLDIPNKRSSHIKPTALSGGIGFLTSFFMILVVIFWGELNLYSWIFLSIFCLAGISLFDDVRPLSSSIRFALQILVASILYFEGFALKSIDIPGLIIPLDAGLSLIATVFFILSLINIYNFMDGIDGYAAGTGICFCLFFSAAFYAFGDTNSSLVCLVLASTLCGFLVFNFPKASLFMGDVGSATLGCIFAILSIKFTQLPISSIKGYSNSIVVPMIVLGVFILDASTTLLIRAYKKEKFWKPHRSHFYQKLNRINWTHKKIISIEYLHTLFNCLIAFIWILGDFQIQVLCILIFVIVFLLKFSYIQKKFNKKELV